MSELLNKGYLTNDGAFILWGVLTGFAVIKYAYSTRCFTRSLDLMDPEEKEAMRQKKAAEERLCKMLDDSIGPFKGTKSKKMVKDGVWDMEEGNGSCDEIEGSSNGDSDTNNNEIQAFSNACAICLDEFDDGVNVVRSVATSGCPHIFHDECLKEVVSAAIGKGNYTIPCPCCRQTFVETDPPVQPNAIPQQ